MRSGPIRDFTATTGTLAIEVDGDVATLHRQLLAAGLEAVHEGRQVLVALDGDAAYDVIRDACDDWGLGLVRIEPRRQSLEDIFRERSGGSVDAAG